MIQGLLGEAGIPSVLQRSSGFDVPEFLASGPRDVKVVSDLAAKARSVLADTMVAEGEDPEWTELEEQARLRDGETSPGRLALWVATAFLGGADPGLGALPAHLTALGRAMPRRWSRQAASMSPKRASKASSMVGTGAAGLEFVDQSLAGLRAALVLEQVEDRAAEDHRVAARGGEGRPRALAQASDHGRSVEADLAGEVLGAAFDQPGPAQVAGKAAWGPRGGEGRVVGGDHRAGRRGARRCRAAPRRSPRRRLAVPCGGR